MPAYSPDLNPIEMMWSKVKALLRKAQARNHSDLLAAIASALNAVTPGDVPGWFTHFGYSFIFNALANHGGFTMRLMRNDSVVPPRIVRFGQEKLRLKQK